MITLAKFCEACQAIPTHGYCDLSGCPQAIVVGHKTMRGGHHEPLMRFDSDKMMLDIDARTKRLDAAMPTAEAAITSMHDAYDRLISLGWRDAIYCPKDGSTFEVIEAGSTGIHIAHYAGAWPEGSWWIHGDGDLWPSRPILFRPFTNGASGVV